MNELDALARVIFSYIKSHNGQTILIKNIEKDTAITATTIRKKIKMLVEKGYINRDGKNFTIIKKGD